MAALVVLVEDVAGMLIEGDRYPVVLCNYFYFFCILNDCLDGKMGNDAWRDSSLVTTDGGHGDGGDGEEDETSNHITIDSKCPTLGTPTIPIHLSTTYHPPPPTTTTTTYPLRPLPIPKESLGTRSNHGTTSIYRPSIHPSISISFTTSFRLTSHLSSIHPSIHPPTLLPLPQSPLSTSSPGLPHRH